MSNEIILHQSSELLERIEVRLENDAVWLHRQQISLLSGRDVKTIVKHINNVFAEGELHAYEMASKIIRSAKRSIIWLDNYNYENTLTLFTKKSQDVKVTSLFKMISKQLVLDVQKAHGQYGDFTMKTFDKSHDRFLIIDNTIVYHLGALLKDLGKKWFAFSRMDKNSVENILKGIPNE